MKSFRHLFLIFTFATGLIPAHAATTPAAKSSRPPTSRRTQRVVPMKEVVVASPDGNVKFTVLPNAERLSYSVRLGETTVLEPSAIKLQVDGYDLGSGVIFQKIERFETNDSYPWHGAHSTAVDRSHGARISFTNDLAMQEFVLEVRAFNDGVGYRLVVPGAADAVRTPDEFSEFVLPAGAVAWFHDLDGHYEAAYERKTANEIEAGQWAGPPVTLQLPHGAGYAVITEANLINYSGMALEADGRRGWIVGLGHRQPVNYPYELRYGREEAKRLGRPATVTGPITTPWRVVLAGRDLNTIVNSDVISNLCPPADPKLFPAGMKTPWVEPGLCVWDYVDRNYVPRGDTSQIDHMKNFSRMGGLIGAKYHILEGFAYGWPDDQIRDFVAYSKQQGVRVLFWRHSRNLRKAEEQREFFDRLQRLGVAGAKIDFFDHEAKENIDLYEVLARLAAERQLVLDFHGANKPTGRLRTLPNTMLYEGVRGMESSSLRERARHEVTLPFARYLTGPVDYTTMIFTERRRDSTVAHQIAALATFHSPMLTIAAHPQSILDSPALDVIRSIKAVWDETIVLPESRIGELSVFARRSGDIWMLAVMSARLATTLRLPLAFLGEGSYQATYVRDDKARPDAVQMETAAAARSDILVIDLAAGGGFVGRFVRK